MTSLKSIPRRLLLWLKRPPYNKRLQNDRQIATRFGTLALLGGI
jgi:hypothetical protein